VITEANFRDQVLGPRSRASRSKTSPHSPFVAANQLCRQLCLSQLADITHVQKFGLFTKLVAPEKFTLLNIEQSMRADHEQEQREAPRLLKVVDAAAIRN